jgi:hypothetical protein
LRAGFGLRGAVPAAIAASVAIAFAFNGLALAMARYPHFEILIVGSVILFTVALVRRQFVAAAIFFSVALLTREDAGFHLFGILFVLIALNRWYGIAWRAHRAEIGFAMIALLYSIAAVSAAAVLATGPSAFERIYVGDPPFASLTAAAVGGRLLGCMAFRTYLVLPAVVALFWAARTRNPYILVGYAAFFPWGLLQLAAHSDIAGTLSGYYGYPFMIASFWPLVGVLFDRRHIEDAAPADPRRGTSAPVLAFAAMIVASFASIGAQYNPGQFDLWRGFSTPPGPARMAETDHAIAQLARSKAVLGAVLVDGSVAALAPDDFAWSETVLGHGSGRPDSVVYFVHGYESSEAQRIAAANGLIRRYRVIGTPIRIATDRPIAAQAPIAALVPPAERAD